MEIYREARFVVEEHIFRGPGGTQKKRVVVRPGNAVAILPIEGEYCHLIRQYRHAIDQYIFEAPAGTIDEGEAPVKTAYRELIEETGLEAKTLIPRGYIYTTPGFTDEVIYLFEARDLSPSTAYTPDDDEVIEPIRVKIDELFGLIDNGRIVDAKTICLACRCLRWKE